MTRRFRDRDSKNSIILKTIAYQSLHIWHIFLGIPSSNNDVYVLDRSSLIHNMLISEATDMTFEVNDLEYKGYYLLADNIYPE